LGNFLKYLLILILMVFCSVFGNVICIQVAVVGGMTLPVGKRMNLAIGIQIKGEEFLGEVADEEAGVLMTWETTGNGFCF
jgi:hypothetical protein